jgi:DNA-binding MarR family transcriptional regulator
MTGEIDPVTTDGDDDALETAWPLLMGVVLEQRWRWSEVATELGLSQAGLRALLGIDPDQPRPMRDLARTMNCDPSYVTAMVDDLERAGYAERQSLPADRRVKTVALTSSGRQALPRTRPDVPAHPNGTSTARPTARRSPERTGSA